MEINVVFDKLVTNNCHLMQMDPLPYNYGVIAILVSGYDIENMVKVYLNLDNLFNELKSKLVKEPSKKLILKGY